jgi:ABC-type phosphate/phosphonate transport system substrate-binding protein
MTARIVSLPMYDSDHANVQAWWDVLAPMMRDEGLRDLPLRLAWPEDLAAHWREPALLLSQTCGYELFTDLRGQIQLIGALRYNAPGCSGVEYRSVVVVRACTEFCSIEELRGRVAVINDLNSHSGCNVLRGLVAPLAREGRFFSRWLISGSHRHSLELMRAGKADVATIDCASLAGLRRQRRDILDGFRILGMTPLVPGPPLVTAATTSSEDVGRMRRAVARACADPSSQSLRDALFIDGFEVVDAEIWQPIDEIRQSAFALG